MSSQRLAEVGEARRTCPRSPTRMLGQREPDRHHERIGDEEREDDRRPARAAPPRGRFSFSSSRVQRETTMRSAGSAAPAAPPAPATTGSFKARRSGVDLARARPPPTSPPPRASSCRSHACAYITVTMYLFHASAAFLSGWPGVAHQPRSAGCGAVLNGSITGSCFHIAWFSQSRVGADREALLHDEPLLVVLLAVRPAQELVRALRVLRVLHHHVVERGVVGVLRPSGPPAAARAGCRCAAARPSRS